MTFVNYTAVGGAYHLAEFTYIDMSWDIALNTRVVVGNPGTTDIIASFEDGVLDNITQRWETMLELMGHNESRKACADGDDSNPPRGICILRAKVVRVIAMIAIRVLFRGGCFHSCSWRAGQLSFGEWRPNQRCCR